MKKFTLTTLMIAILGASQVVVAAGTNPFTGTTATSTGTVPAEITATSNTVAKENTAGATSPDAQGATTTPSSITPDTDAQKKATAQALQQLEGSASEATIECATSPDGLGQHMIKTQAELQKENLNTPTISDMVAAAKENKNALSVGCFTASTEVINLSGLVPDLKNGLGSAIGKIVQKQIDTMINKTKDALMQQVCDVGNEMINKAMQPINDQIAKANGTIMGLSLDSLVGSQIATAFGGDDAFSKIVRESLTEVVSQTDAQLAAARDQYAQQIGYSDTYDPLAGLKSTANQMYNDADAIATNTANNVSGALTGTTTTTTQPAVAPAPTTDTTVKNIPNVSRPTTNGGTSSLVAPINKTPTAPAPTSNNTSTTTSGGTNRFTGTTTSGNSTGVNPFK